MLQRSLLLAPATHVRTVTQAKNLVCSLQVSHCDDLTSSRCGFLALVQMRVDIDLRRSTDDCLHEATPLAIFAVVIHLPSFCRSGTPGLLRGVPHTGCAPDEPHTLDSSITRRRTPGELRGFQMIHNMLRLLKSHPRFVQSSCLPLACHQVSSTCCFSPSSNC